MRVLITGGTGVVGKSITERLVRNGWDVRVIGIEPDLQIQGAEYTCCDIMDYPLLHDQMRGCEVVIHLAAIASPRRAFGHDIFRINAAGTFNVFEAAAAEGIKRVVQASSINAIGCAWSITDIAPRYFPIDEDHPVNTTDPYSFSKNVVEDIGDYYWRREGISSVALRFPWVMHTDRLNSESFRQQRQAVLALLSELADQPTEERTARLAEVQQTALDFRGRRSLEYPTVSEPVDDLLWKIYTFDRFNFWAFVDERDSAQAMEKGLLANFEGSHALFINGDHNWLGCDSELLLRLFYPQVSERKHPLHGSEALVSIERARALLGFEPEYATPVV